MQLLKHALGIGSLALLFSCTSQPKTEVEPVLESRDAVAYAPEKYVALHTNGAIRIDGNINDAAWSKAPWTNTFVDIEGDQKPLPTYPTKAKMLWDDNYFYFAFELEEPQIWATLTERDAVIFRDNDIEIFIDPDGDTHHYYEYEMNAFNTQWDLILTKPYRDAKMHVLDAWTLRGMKSAVKIYGTLNNSKDIDKKWTVEVALPWSDLEEANSHNGTPNMNEIWKVNFSRVNWDVDRQKDGTYQKTKDANSGKTLPEHNWVWSPQGVIAMHQPETWGLVQFSNETQGEVAFHDNGEDQAKWLMRQIYYAQSAYIKKYGKPANQANSLGLSKVMAPEQLSSVKIVSNGKNRWEATMPFSEKEVMVIQWDGEVWKEQK
ncbi:carbohydrate-binding family 9-like protein [Halosquirtibacter xylanolyticus]|uniref:carbohydrate-binding family 9-like protein n=1 Tax=Halosquirtibacter xylanolyticus TaxID=3374599 RepID=UPI003748B0A4|nr:carbohydrate-binding family 9-like protein [Prolixibacteraceae bacterium]